MTRTGALDWRPVLAAAATGILVGAAIVATRSVADQASPAALAFLRYAIGLACLAPPLALVHNGRGLIARGDRVPIALLGIAQFALVIVLLNWALQRIPSARAALIFATSPLLTLLFGAVLRAERMTPPKVAGALLSVVGVGLALGEKALGAGAGGWAGELAALGSAASAALCSVLYRPYLRRYPALTVSTYAMFASVAFLGVWAAAEGFFVSIPRFSVAGWLAIVFIGLNSGVGYY
ncbi:MAG TPA: DMT family transporter, partial [Roseiflexaceae bacterium]|nr:DMT family transporter [Roseiflexaceae bacterium]